MECIKAEYLKVAVLNNSGNVGKSTICQTLLEPRIKGAKMIRIETSNVDGNATKGLSSSNMVAVIQQIDLADVAIIDVGSSNIEGFIKGMKKNEGAHEDIDYYLVPVIPETKQQFDTINTINTLLDMGVPKESIKVILNRVNSDVEDIKSQFDTFYKSDVAKEIGFTSIKEPTIIFDSELFQLLNLTYQDLKTVLNDKTDYRKLLREEKDLEKRSIISLKRSALRLAKGHERCLDEAFKNLKLV